MRWGGVALRRAPFGVGLVGVLWAVGVATSSVDNGPSAGLMRQVGVGIPALAHGRWWTPLTSMLWCDSLAGYLLTTTMILAVCVAAERQLGSVRTGVTFVTGNIVGGLVGVGLVATGSALGEWWSASLYDALAVGASPGGAAVALALSWRCSSLWRRRLRLLLLITLGMLVLYSGQLQDVVRMAAGLTGLLLGRWLFRPDGTQRVSAPSRPEARLLLALITAASAVGPLIAVASGTSVGPLSSLRYVFVPAVPDIAEVAAECADATHVSACHALQSQLVMHGFAPAFTAVIPVLLLLVLAEGLRRGRRFALWGVVVINVALTVFGVVSLEAAPSLVTTIMDGAQSYQNLELLLGLIVATLQPLAVVALLVHHRGAFDVTAPPRTYRRLAATVGVVLVVLSLAYVGGGRLVAAQFASPPGIGDLLLDLPWRFLPPGYVEPATFDVVPVGVLATLLYDWTGVVLWAVLLLGAWTTFWGSHAHSGAGDAVRARWLLMKHGGSQLSYMTTWQGNRYWFSPDGRCVVAYKLVASVAVTVGDPIGDPAVIPAAVRGFAEFCATNGWTPCLYSVTEELASALGCAGWKLIQVAEDTVLPLTGLSFTGRRWQDIRTAMSRARRDGITVEWHQFGQCPPAITNQIRSISAQWIRDKGIPEMGFTLGGLRELSDDEVRCLIAIDANGTVHAVTSWLPIYRAGNVVGWTLDMMRRSQTSGNGIMEFLIASAALQFKAEGSTFLSLSGAPLARHDLSGKMTGMGRLLDRIGRILEPVYGFASLVAFKAKFQPVYRPLFLAYPDSAALPSIGAAITRAYLPLITVRQAMRLVALTLYRRPPRASMPTRGTHEPDSRRHSPAAR